MGSIKKELGIEFTNSYSPLFIPRQVNSGFLNQRFVVFAAASHGGNAVGDGVGTFQQEPAVIVLFHQERNHVFVWVFWRERIVNVDRRAQSGNDRLEILDESRRVHIA